MLKSIDPILLPQAEYAFFHAFHESQKTVFDGLEELLTTRIKNAEELMNGDLTPTTGFRSIEQYESYVGAARDVGLQIASDIGTIEAYRTVLHYEIEGYKTLLPFARDYDKFSEEMSVKDPNYRAEVHQKFLIRRTSEQLSKI